MGGSPILKQINGCRILIQLLAGLPSQWSWHVYPKASGSAKHHLKSISSVSSMAFRMEEYSLFHNNFTQKNETSQNGLAKTYIVGKNKPTGSHLGVPGRAQSLLAVL